MNYIHELRLFKDWLMLHSLSTGQVAVWYSLMSSKLLQGEEEKFVVHNQVLQIMTGLSRQGVDKARKRLIELGLIQYQKGDQHQPDVYRMISLSNHVNQSY